MHQRLLIGSRGLVLFVFGVFFCLLFNLVHVQRHITIFAPDMVDSLFSSEWWIPPICGSAAALIGLLYPCLDRKFGICSEYHVEWASVMRCIAVFVGINHLGAKLDFEDNIQLSLSLAAMSVGLWWLFDRSKSGLGLGISIALLSVIVTQSLTYIGVYRCKQEHVCTPSWLPSIFFAGGVTMGKIGRQLALYDKYWRKSKTE